MPTAEQETTVQYHPILVTYMVAHETPFLTTLRIL